MEVLFESSSTRIEKFRRDGVDLVRKIVRGRFAKALTKHEITVLKRLKWIEWVQEFVEQESPTSFTSRFIPGKTLLEYEGRELPEWVFEKLEAILEAVHHEWVADPDFAHSVDIIVTPEWNPVLIDLASAIIYDPKDWSQFWKKYLFQYFSKLNKLYLVKRKARFAPHLITHQEQEALKQMWIGPKVAKYWRQFWRFVKKNPYFRKD